MNAGRRAGAFALVLLAALTLPALTLAPAARAEIGAYVLFDVETGEVLAEHEATRPWYPASITKLLTVYVAFEAVREGTLTFTSPVKISAQANQQPPSRMGFAVGTTLTLEAALRLLMTKSANDVAVAVAEAVGGTQAAFMDAMNETAARLGMSSSHFDNPHGLPNTSHVSSARDLALLAIAIAKDFPEWSDFLSMDAVTLGRQMIPNHNALMRRFPGADGMKTGFICASGFNIAATATRGDVRLGAVVLGGRTSTERDQRTAELLHKGFEAVATGGIVELDGFGDPEGRHMLSPVAGERPPLGTVAELAPRPDAPVADRRDEVCGAKRAVTRYDDGVAATVAEVEAAREAVLAWAELASAREAAKQVALRTPRRAVAVAGAEPASLPTADAEASTTAASAMTVTEAETETVATAPLGYAPASVETDAQSTDGSAALQALAALPAGPPRVLADEALRPVAWTPTVATLAPQPRPWRPRLPSDFAPDGFVPSPAIPPSHPFEPTLREPLPPRPEARPLGYLGPARPARAIAISLGGADPTRPDPLSGPIVGGGPAPIPMPKPTPVAALLGEPIDPTAVVEHALAVREAMGASRQDDGVGVP